MKSHGKNLVSIEEWYNNMDCKCGFGEHSHLCFTNSTMGRNSYWLAVLHCFGLLLVMTSASLTFDYRLHMCNNATSYADGSTYSINLRSVMDLLADNASLAGFGNYSYGQSPHKVYGLLQCIGNITQQDCKSCSQKAQSRLQEYCGNYIGGQIWMSYCFLRYSNSSFFSKLDTEGDYLYNVKPIPAQNVLSWKNITIGLLSNLTNMALRGAGFAAASSPYTLSDGVSGDLYGLVQCWRDISINDCRSCLSFAIQAVDKCCLDHKGAQALLGSCTVRVDQYPFYLPSNTLPTPPPSEKSSPKLAIILGITGSVILGIVSVCIFAMRKKMPYLKQKAVAKANKDAQQKMLFKKTLTVFSLKTLIEATEGFSSNNKLGEGGFGSVYKGGIQDGQEIAVKKLSARPGQGTREFMNEVEIVANIQHRNLVKLLGCCVEGDERLLVYEFLPNKSLDTFLFDPMKSKQLDWQKRYDIIVGIARGLLYLHQDSQVRIIHRDIKANNILLDEKLNPKITDFGLARLFPDNETEIQSRVTGTYGYMAPEYATRGLLSVKADVYSFGVLLLEIVSGRTNMDMKLLKETQISSLVEWAWTLFKQGNMLIMVDGAVAETCPEEEALRCIQVGLLCTQADANVRPLMSTVVVMMSSSSEELPSPTKPAYVSMGQSLSDSQNPCPSFTSTTVLEGR